MNDEFFDPDMDESAGDATRWQPAERAPRRRPPGVVLSVRVHPEIADRLEALARARGISLSEAAREALTAAVQGSQAVPYSVRVAENSVSEQYGTLSVTLAQRGSLSAGLLTGPTLQKAG